MEEDLSVSRIQKPNSGSGSQQESIQQEQGEATSESKTGISDKLISLNLLDKKNIRKIKLDFKKKEQGLQKEEFVRVMLHHLPPENDKVSLVASLNQLFAQIDVNDDQHLEWDEFTNYIIQAGLLKKDHGFVDIIKNYKQADWKDPVKHDNDIQYIHFIPPLKQLLVMQRDSKKFKIYNSKTLKYQREVRGHQGAVLVAHHLEKYSTVCTSSNDLSIHMWDDTAYILKNKMRSPIIPLCLADYQKNLYAGGPQGWIYYWDMYQVLQRNNTSYYAFPKQKDFQHNDSVSAMLSIPQINIMATADLLGQLLLWDLPTHTPNRKMDKLSKGIHSLDWNGDIGCLFSAGLDRTAYVWNPYVNMWIKKINQHNHSLVSIKCIPNTHQMVTADISGMFKVWDIRTFNVIQSFNAPVAELNTFAATYPDKKIIAGGKWLYQYTYQEPKDQNQVDQGIPISCLFNPQYSSFITAHPSCVKIWDMNTGRLIKVFRDICPGDITCLALDKKLRKMFVGDSEGNIFTLKVKNGAKIKSFTQHQHQVSFLLYWAQYKFLISASRDCKVHVHDDSTSEEFGELRNKKIRHQDIVSCVDLNSDMRFVASGSDDMIVQINNLQTQRKEAELKQHQAEVKAVKFLYPENILVSTDLEGMIYFWGVSPSNLKNTLIMKLTNQVLTDTGVLDNTPIRALAWDSQKKILFTGDQKGHLKQWDITQLGKRLKAIGVKSDTTINKKQEDNLDMSAFYITALNIGIDKMIEMLQQIEIHPFSDFAAHTEGIIHIHLVEHLSMIITSGFDVRTHIWDYSGRRLGTLIVGGDPHWNVKIDITQQNQKIKKEALNLLDQSMSVSYQDMIKKFDSTVQISDTESDSGDSANDDFLFSKKIPKLEPDPAKVTINKAKEKVVDPLTVMIQERKLALQRLQGPIQASVNRSYRSRDQSNSSFQQSVSSRSSGRRALSGVGRRVITNR